MSKEQHSPLINPSDLKNLLKNGDLVVIDARSGTDAQVRFRTGHIEGALHADLDHDLSQKSDSPAQGGRHPLPDYKTFGIFLGTLGITPSSFVVVYDDKNGANAAARFWWMLKAQGHEQIQVIDGGLQAAVNEGLPIVQDTRASVRGAEPYPTHPWYTETADINKVEEALSDPSFIVIDVREAYRYKGESEPLDKIAGHIPGAVNVPYPENLTVSGQFLPANELALKYKKIIGSRNPENVIVHCGSGVTACHTLLALEQAGIKGPKLYVGSWSEWSSSGHPVATGQ